MIKPVGQELFRLYCKLWQKFGEQEFPMQKAVLIIKPMYKKNPDIPYVLVSRLTKAGWVMRRKEKKNLFLSLTNPNKIIKEVSNT